MSQSLRLAFCSMIAALSAAVMFLTGVVPLGTYALPALAGLLLIPVVVEFGAGWAWPVYAAVSLLSFLLAGDKEAALCYVLMLGCYPILKASIERKMKRLPGCLLKFAFFNAAAVAEFFLAVSLLNVPRNSFNIFGVNAPWLMLLAGNAVFAVYDYAASLLAAEYCGKVHPRVSKWLHLH